ncbi:SseB family protein [Leucobacter chironomi]|uniref:SseB family protein n=1 Tax=Leucobacter chironomi TaxID=491918 RepID=UPI00041E907A|nr:SseB family protein [Leucobacter chironomi]
MAENPQLPESDATHDASTHDATAHDATAHDAAANTDSADSADAAPEALIPDEVHPDYANDAVREALRELQQQPDYARLAGFLNSLRDGYLVADVTGTSSKKKGPRVRTIRSTKGQLVLPLFTSMAELRAVAPAERRAEVKGAIMPAHEAIALIRTDRFVAAEFDKAGASLVVLRKYLALALEPDAVTADQLEQMR